MRSLWGAVAQGEIYHSLTPAILKLILRIFSELCYSNDTNCTSHGHLNSERMCGRET
jgi:hypothetical protein